MPDPFRNRRKPYRGPNYRLRRWTLVVVLVITLIYLAVTGQFSELISGTYPR